MFWDFGRFVFDRAVKTAFYLPGKNFCREKFFIRRLLLFSDITAIVGQNFD